MQQRPARSSFSKGNCSCWKLQLKAPRLWTSQRRGKCQSVSYFASSSQKDQLDLAALIVVLATFRYKVAVEVRKHADLLVIRSAPLILVPLIVSLMLAAVVGKYYQASGLQPPGLAVGPFAIGTMIASHLKS